MPDMQRKFARHNPIPGGEKPSLLYASIAQLD